MSLQQHDGIDQDYLFANPDEDFNLLGFDDDMTSILADDILGSIGSGDSGHDDGRESTSPSSSTANNNGDIHTKFITTLHRIVSDTSTDKAISWLPCGTVSYIHTMCSLLICVHMICTMKL